MEFIPTKLGVALIEGFDRMNFDTSLGKPFLRKEMESKMKAICEGRTTRQAVLNESIGQYRQVYNQSQEKLHVLRAVSRPSGSERIFARILTSAANSSLGLQTISLWQWSWLIRLLYTWRPSPGLQSHNEDVVRLMTTICCFCTLFRIRNCQRQVCNERT
jgi:hypothetical protein